MGVVYKAQDTKLKRMVALKFLPQHTMAGAEERDRFEHEAQAAAALDHPNICTVYEINEADNRSFIAMAYVEGQSLQDIGGETPMPLPDALNFAIQIAEGLQAAHEKNIVHRDIKPANILITAKGLVRITDFGLAKLAGRTQLTKEGVSMGTMAYMSPEQTQGAEVDHRTDIWALGVVIYEMITGQQPFIGDYEQAVMYSVLNEDPEPPTALRTGVPMELERIVHKSLAKKPAERYQNLADMLVDLKVLQKSSRSGDSKTKASVALGLKHVPDEIETRQVSRKSKIGLLLAIPILFMLSALAVFNLGGKSNLDKPAFNSIAVLPFADLSRDRDQEYFCDGITQEILTKLSRLENLKVIARTSVMRYKNTDKSIKQIAEELSVESLLEGSIRKDGDEIRVTAQLINAKDESQLWSENYDRKFAGVFKLQEEISKAIAKALRGKLTSQQIEKFVSPQPRDNQAYELVLKGAYHIQNVFLRTGEQHDFEVGLNYFDEAIALDTTYASAFIEKAFAYHMRWVANGFGDIEALQICKKFAEKGLSLESNSARANAMLATANVTFGETDAAYTNFKEAFRLNPNEELAHHSASFFMMTHGMQGEALRFREKALELDPNYPPFHLLLVDFLFNFGKLNEAERANRRYAATFPDNPGVQRFVTSRKAAFAAFRGDLETASTLIAELGPIDERGVATKEINAIILALRGQKEEALQSFDDAGIYALLGFKDEAILQLRKKMERAKALYKSWYAVLKNYPSLELLQVDPRFQAILRQEKEKAERFRKKYGALVTVLDE